MPQLAELRTRADTVIEYDFHLMHRKGLFLARTGCSRQRSGASAVGGEPDVGLPTSIPPFLTQPGRPDQLIYIVGASKNDSER